MARSRRPPRATRPRAGVPHRVFSGTARSSHHTWRMTGGASSWNGDRGDPGDRGRGPTEGASLHHVLLLRDTGPVAAAASLTRSRLIWSFRVGFEGGRPPVPASSAPEIGACPADRHPAPAPTRNRLSLQRNMLAREAFLPFVDGTPYCRAGLYEPTSTPATDRPPPASRPSPRPRGDAARSAPRRRGRRPTGGPPPA